MKLRTSLAFLVIGTIVPVFILATFLGVLLVRREQEAFKQGAINRNRAFMAAVDAALQGNISTLQSLAANSSLEEDDLDKFRIDATRALKSQTDWQDVILTKPDGQQLVDVVFGREPRTSVTDEWSLNRLIAEQKPVVGSVSYREFLGKYGIAVRVPVIRQGKFDFVLSAIIDPDQFARLLRDQHLPEEWVSGLVDATGHFVARVPYRSNAEVGSSRFMSEIQKSSEGWYRGLTVDGRDTYTAHRTSSLSNWSVGMAIPAREVNAGTIRATWIMLIGTILTLALALGFAYLMGRRIATPIARLAEAARAMGKSSEPVAIHGDVSIDEVRELTQAFYDANDAIHEREVLASREQAGLKAADRAKDEFLAMLGHELRNPLAAIMTSAHVLRTAESLAIASHAHEVIERQTNHMTRLVEDLLNVSRVTMGKINLQLETFNLAELVENVTDTFEGSGRARVGQILTQTEEVWIHADRSRLEQVLTNLLDNALKFSLPGKPISVSVGREGEEAVLEVSDGGEGIEPELQEKLFGLFVQGPRGADRAHGGLGLGLALVKRIVEMHNGNITVSSDGKDRGATFRITLPSTAELPAKKQIEEVNLNSFASRRILVVEDNADARDMIEAVLKIEGHTVTVAAHGEKALETVRNSSVDVVLLDVGLPDLDGYEVARRMRELDGGDRLKIVALTGYGQAEDQRRAFEAGFDVHLTKPVAFDKLNAILTSFGNGQKS